MRRVAVLSVSPTLLLAAVLVTPAETQEPELVGAWTAATWEGASGEAQPGLLIFTETHYSMMFVPAGLVREEWAGETMSDADMVAAFKTLVANSGRYTRDGDRIITEAFVSLNPNYMARWGDNHLAYTFRLEGDVLRLTWPEGFMEPGGPSFTGTFRRVRQPAS